MRVLKLILLTMVVFITIHAHAQQSGVISLSRENLHTRLREWPYPANGITVPNSSPALLWPGTNGTENIVLAGDIGDEFDLDPEIQNVRYKVTLASDKNFTKNVLNSREQRWAMYALHQPLQPGRWYWKYAFAKKGSKNWVWSDVYDFVVSPQKSASGASPTVEQVLDKAKGPHPRLWNMNRIEDRFYKNNLNNPEAKKFIAFAEKLMKEPLPEEKPRKIIDTTGKTELQKKINIEAMYHGFGDYVGTPVRNLCIAYQLTRDRRFIEDAKKRALNIAHMNPDGLATRDDFTSGAVLEALGWFYDAGYKVLNDEEKKLLQQVIQLRGRRVYQVLPNRFEININDNHVWQITLRNLAIGALSVLGEVPEVTEWLTYIYEVWSARFPVLGNTDGGWHEGSGYFKVNFRSFIYLPQLLSDISGVDYFKQPWMQNLPYFLLYTHPPAASCMAMGDMWEKEPGIAKIDAVFADALTYKIDNPYLNAYVADIRKYYPKHFDGTDDLLLFRLLNHDPTHSLPQQSLNQLPKSRLFRDMGIVAMHENLSQPQTNLSSYFYSCPIGSSGHGHAFQNGFTLNYKGKTVFGNTGYYSNFSDRHNLLHYRTSRAYNTILADSLGQKIGENGYGWMPRFITGQHIQYALGDATNAYGPITNEFWLDRFQRINVQPNKANGYGQPGVTLYRRHMLQLDGGYVLLYDELEAQQPITWTNQFQVPYFTIQGLNPTADNKQQNFEVLTDSGKVMASVFGASPLNLKVTDQFAEPAVNWNNVAGPDGKIIDYKNQWRAGVTSMPEKRFRFLTIIQVKDNKIVMPVATRNANGTISINLGDWAIQAQLDGNKPPALQVENAVFNTVFNYGNLPVQLLKKNYQHAKACSSMLIERRNGVLNRQEVVDELPDVAKFDYGK